MSDTPTPDTPTPDETVPATPRPARTPAPVFEPFSHDELRACLTRPARNLDVVLAGRGRLIANVNGQAHLVILLAVLGFCSVLFTLPFAAVDGAANSARLALLFAGSALICFPSLHVFASYLGLRLSLEQNLALTLVIPAATALFTVGFAPIYWFLTATMPADSNVSGTATRVVLLVAAMLLGLSHLNRCLFGDATLKQLRASWPLWIGWQVLLLWITWRMAQTLGVFA